jgi:hypothetical protein
MGLFDSTNTTKPQVPKFAQGLYKDIFNSAERAFKQGPYVYNKSTVPGFSASTKAAFGGMKDLAGANTGTNGMAPGLQEIMSNGGFSADQLDSMGTMKDLINNAGMNQIINDTNGMTEAQNRAYSSLQDGVYANNDALQKTFDQGGLTDDQMGVADFYRAGMNEQFDPENMAGYSHVRSRTLDAGANAVAGQAAKMGRLGGAANQGILARTQMDSAAAMDNAELDKWRARTADRAGGLASLSQVGVGNQLGINSAQQAGLGEIRDTGALGVNQRNSALALKGDMNNNLFNAQASGLDRVGQAYNTALQPYQTQRAVGAEYEQKNAERIADKLRRFEAQNPLTHLQNYMGLANGTPMGSTQTTSPSLAQLLTAGGLTALSLPTMMNWGGATGSATTGMTG